MSKRTDPPADVVQYACPNCGAPLTFGSESQKLECASCGSSFELEEIRKRDDVEDDARWNHYGSDSGSGDWQAGEKNHLRAYSCPSCGAEIVCDDTTAATFCVYCHNPSIVPSQLSGAYRPDVVIPFKLDKKAATEAFKRHCSKKPLLPRSFCTETQVEKLSGVYAPFWLYNCRADARARYEGRRTTMWREGKYEVTRTDVYDVYRAGGMDFHDVPVDGASKLDDALMESVEPFDCADAKPFSTAYLSGYLAEKYDQDADACAPRANERVKTSAESLLRDTVIGYETVLPMHAGVRLEKGSIRYALMPVWLLYAKYRDKQYVFAMNGQTGRFIGDLPVSRGRFFAWLGGLTAACGACFYGLSALLSALGVFA